MGSSKKSRSAAFLLLGAPFLVILLLFAFIGGRMDGDGQSYYIYLRSAVFDGDLDLRNDYEMFPRDDPLIAHICINAKGPAPNVFSVGPAVIWSPFFLVTRLISLAMPPDYIGNVNQGKGEPYYTTICLTSIIDSMAASPTFLTATSPNLIFKPITVNVLPLSLISGGSTSMPEIRHSAIYLTTPSVECISLVSSEAMNSRG